MTRLLMRIYTNRLEIIDVPEVIDLDTYETQFCTCVVEQMRAPQYRVFLILLALQLHWRRDSSSVVSPTPLDATEYVAREARRRYQCAYCACARLAHDLAQSRAQLLP